MLDRGDEADEWQQGECANITRKVVEEKLQLVGSHQCQKLDQKDHCGQVRDGRCNKLDCNIMNHFRCFR